MDSTQVNKQNDTVTKTTEKPPKPQRRNGDPEGYNPGGESVKITAKCIKRNLVFNQLMVDLAAITALGLVGSSVTFPFYEKVSAQGVLQRPVWTTLWVRMINLVLFKQLGATLSPNQTYVGDYYGKNLGRRVLVPSGLLPILRQYGTVSSEEGDWIVLGQAFLLSTALLRSIGNADEGYGNVAQPVNRETSFGFDANGPNNWEFCLEWCFGVVNQWNHVNELRMNVNGVICVCSRVYLKQGAELFFRAYQATNFPLHVLTALRIAVICEAALAVNPIPRGNNIPLATVQALNAQGVVVYSWTREVVEDRFARYYNNVQNALHPVLDECFTMTEVSSMANRGELSQLVTRTNFENAFSYFKLAGDNTEMGCMMSTTGTGAMVINEPFRVESEFSSTDMVAKWFTGMLKGKKNKA